MKIRIKGNSLRYRLTKTDVELFSKNGYLEEVTDFGRQQFVYAIQSYSLPNLTANFDNCSITLFMPVDMVEEWATTDRVGFAGTDDQLQLLIEKDFKCLDDVAEDQSDNYPNPLLNR